MRLRVRLLKLHEEKDGPPPQGTNTQQRVKKTRILGHIDPKAKKRTMLRRMRNRANTSQRKGINLKAAAKAEKRVGGQKAERRVANTKLKREEVAQGAKIAMQAKKKRSQNQITKIEIRDVSQIKNLKRTRKEEIVRELEQSREARTERQKIDTDLAAGIGIEVDVQYQKTKKKNEKKTETGAENVAGVRKGGTTVKGTIRSKAHPGIQNVEQEVQTEISLETLREAGAPEARAIRETAAKISRPIERTKTEKPPTTGGDVVAAGLTVIEMRGGRGKTVQIPDGAEQIVPPNPKTEEAQPNQGQTVQRAKTETTARGINQALAQALTATDILKIDWRVLKTLFYTYYTCGMQHQLSICSGTYSHSSFSAKTLSLTQGLAKANEIQVCWS